jgi:hypothetical protein
MAMTLALVGVGAAAWATTSTGTFDVRGNLDEHKGQCHGQARLVAGDTAGCYAIERDSESCSPRAAKDIDWVFDADTPHARSPDLCRDGGWKLQPGLPGLGSCEVKNVKEAADGKPVSLALGCVWMCRDRSCDGAAEYRFRFGP